MLPRAARLRRGRDIRRVYARKCVVASGDLALHWAPNEMAETRIAFTVGKKVGGAVVRNRIRRKLRAVCRHWLPHLRGGFDCVLVVRRGLAETDSADVMRVVSDLFDRSGLSRQALGRSGDAACDARSSS